jgi:hypothetical protein
MQNRVLNLGPLGVFKAICNPLKWFTGLEVHVHFSV